VIVFDLEGAKLRSIGFLGYLPGQFTRIQGVALEGSGRVLVLDAFQCNAQLLESTGAPVTTFGHLGHWGGALRTPLGIAAFPGERIFVSSEGTSRLEVFAHWAWSRIFPTWEGQGVIVR
jgi:hypothetical protein